MRREQQSRETAYLAEARALSLERAAVAAEAAARKAAAGDAAAARLAAGARAKADEARLAREEKELGVWHARHFYKKAEDLLSKVTVELAVARCSAEACNVAAAWQHQEDAETSFCMSRKARSLLELGPPPKEAPRRPELRKTSVRGSTSFP